MATTEQTFHLNSITILFIDKHAYSQKANNNKRQRYTKS